MRFWRILSLIWLTVAAMTLQPTVRAVPVADAPAESPAEPAPQTAPPADDHETSSSIAARPVLDVWDGQLVRDTRASLTTTPAGTPTRHDNRVVPPADLREPSPAQSSGPAPPADRDQWITSVHRHAPPPAPPALTPTLRDRPHRVA